MVGGEKASGLPYLACVAAELPKGIAGIYNSGDVIDRDLVVKHAVIRGNDSKVAMTEGLRCPLDGKRTSPVDMFMCVRDDRNVRVMVQNIGPERGQSVDTLGQS